MFDGFAGWDTQARFKIRVVCARPYHALFMNNMLIRCAREGGRTRVQKHTGPEAAGGLGCRDSRRPPLTPLASHPRLP